MNHSKSVLMCVIFVAATALQGCYSNHQITKQPVMSQGVTTAGKDQKISAYVSGINLKNGNLAQGFDARLIGRLNKSGLFDNVINGTYQKRPDGAYADLSLDITQTVDNHSVGNSFKGFFTGFTLFLLTPALPLTYDFEAAYTLHARWPNGMSKSYQAECASHAYGTIFQASEAFKLAGSEATDECLNSVVNQMTSDYAKTAK